MIPNQTIDDVRHDYREELGSSSDLQTGGCCPAESMPPALRILIQKSGIAATAVAGALYTEAFRRSMQRPGCLDVRSVSKSLVPLPDAEIEARIGMVNFRSITLRAFRVALEDRRQDYGQVATDRGTRPGRPHAFVLDDHHRFECAKPLPVCSNAFHMLARNRCAAHFVLAGDTSTQFGLFDCAPTAAGALTTDGSTGCC